MSASTSAPTPFFSASACFARKSFCASMRICAAPKAAAAVLASSSRRVDGVEVVVGVVGQGDRRAERLEVLRGDRQLLGAERAGVVADDRHHHVLVGGSRR